MTIIHHTEVCDCSMCRWAEGQARHRAQKESSVSGASEGVQGQQIANSYVLDEPSDYMELVDSRELTTLQQRPTIGAIRNVLVDVLDDGWKLPSGEQAAWLFWDDESDVQTEIRMRFVDLVCERLKQ